MYFQNIFSKKLLLTLFFFALYNLAFVLNLLEQISYTLVNMQKSSVLLCALQKWNGYIVETSYLHRNTQIINWPTLYCFTCQQSVLILDLVQNFVDKHISIFFYVDVNLWFSNICYLTSNICYNKFMFHYKRGRFK